MQIRSNYLYFLIIFFLTFLVLLPFHFGDIPNIEGWNTAIFSNSEFSKGLYRGEYIVWSDKVGFGIPMPINPNQIHHPIIFLYNLLSPSLTLSIFYQIHMTIGAIAIWFLCVNFKVSKNISLVCAFTYLTCSTSADWIFLKFLPSEMFFWSMLPLVVLIQTKLLFVSSHKDKARYTLLLALSYGFTILNAHPTFSILMGIIISIYFILFIKKTINLSWFLIVLPIATIIVASPKIYMIFSEYLLFSSELDRNSARLFADDNWLQVNFVHSLFLKPVFIPHYEEFKSALIDGKLSEIFHILQNQIAKKGFFEFLLENYWHPYLGSNLQERDVFMGPVFAITAILAPIFYRKKMNSYSYVPFMGSVIFFIMMFIVPDSILFYVGRDVFFRDGFFLFGIIASGIIFTKYYYKDSRYRRYIKILILTHIVSILLTYYPTAYSLISHERPFMQADQQSYPGSYRDGWKKIEIIKELKNMGVSNHDRIIFDSEAEKSLPSKLLTAHQHYFAFNDLRQINASTKGIYLNDINNHNVIMEGRIFGDDKFLLDPNMLDIYGLNIIISSKLSNDRNNSLIGTLFDKENKPFYVYRNKDAWSEVTFLPLDINKINFIKKPKCNEESAKCINLNEVKRINEIDLEFKRYANGKIVIDLPKKIGQGIIFISKMYRNSWRAFSDKIDHKVNKTLNGFMSISIDSEVDTITLEYFPKNLYLLISISYFIILLFLVVFFIKKPQ